MALDQVLVFSVDVLDSTLFLSFENCCVNYGLDAFIDNLKRVITL